MGVKIDWSGIGSAWNAEEGKAFGHAPSFLSLLLSLDVRRGNVDPAFAMSVIGFLLSVAEDEKVRGRISASARMIENKARMDQVLADPRLHGARSVVLRVERPNSAIVQLAVHPTSRPDAEGRLQVTRFFLEGGELVPWGHHYLDHGKGVADAIREEWDTYGPFVVESLANPPPWATSLEPSVGPILVNPADDDPGLLAIMLAQDVYAGDVDPDDASGRVAALEAASGSDSFALSEIEQLKSVIDRERVMRSVLASLSGYVAARFALPGDDLEVFVHPTSRPEAAGRYQVTRFWSGEPYGHRYVDGGFEAAVRSAWREELASGSPELVERANPSRRPKEWKKPPVCKPKETGKARVRAKPGDRVRVHRNLHNGCWVVSQGGRVVGYATSVSLRNVRPRIGAAGYERCSRDRTRNVHAYLEGDFVSAKPSRPPRGWRRITYNCKDGPGSYFYFVGSEDPFEGAAEARMAQSGGKASVYVRGQLARENPPPCACTYAAGVCACGKVDGEAVVENEPSCNDPGGEAGTVTVSVGPSLVLLDIGAIRKIRPEAWWSDSCPTVLAYSGPGGRASRGAWRTGKPYKRSREVVRWIAGIMLGSPEEVERHLIANGEAWVASRAEVGRV